MITIKIADESAAAVLAEALRNHANACDRTGGDTDQALALLDKVQRARIKAGHR